MRYLEFFVPQCLLWIVCEVKLKLLLLSVLNKRKFLIVKILFICFAFIYDFKYSLYFTIWPSDRYESGGGANWSGRGDSSTPKTMELVIDKD